MIDKWMRTASGPPPCALHSIPWFLSHSTWKKSRTTRVYLTRNWEAVQCYAMMPGISGHVLYVNNIFDNVIGVRTSDSELPSWNLEISPSVLHRLIIVTKFNRIISVHSEISHCYCAIFSWFRSRWWNRCFTRVCERLVAYCAHQNVLGSKYWVIGAASTLAPQSKWKTRNADKQFFCALWPSTT